MRENELQKMVVEYLKNVYRALVHGTANGATKGERFGVGVLFGIPDLIVFEPRGGYGGLLIELKTETGHLSPTQESMCRALANAGYYVEVCFGFDAFVECVDKYFSLPMWTGERGKTHFYIRS